MIEQSEDDVKKDEDTIPYIDRQEHVTKPTTTTTPIRNNIIAIDTAYLGAHVFKYTKDTHWITDPTLNITTAALTKSVTPKNKNEWSATNSPGVPSRLDDPPPKHRWTNAKV